MNTRYQALCNNFSDYHYHIFGCGAIGSFAALGIAMMDGKKFSLYDTDTVSVENVGISAYNIADIHKAKVVALKRKLMLVDAKEVNMHNVFVDDKLTLQTTGKNIAILAFDNMFSRLEAANLCFKAGIEFVIDARMGAEQIQVYSHHNFKDYHEDWYPDSESSEENCTNKGTSYCSLIVGGIVTSQIKKIISNNPYTREICFHIPSMGMECLTMVNPIIKGEEV